MSGFKPGDEVTLTKEIVWTARAPRWMFWTRWRRGATGPVFGKVYTVTGVGVASALRLPDPTQGDLVVLRFAEWPAWFSSLRFRKVQRRDLSAWLETATDFEEPKRAPVREAA